MGDEKSTGNDKESPVAGYLAAYNVVQFLGWLAIMATILRHLWTEQTHVGIYIVVAPMLNIFQTAAVLEILHSALGLVRSNVVLTGFQVFSRVFLTWGIVYSINTTQNSFGVVLFLLAWAITEIFRYSFYLFALLGKVPYFIQWCRYTFFIVLYPVGVSGELLTVFSGLPQVKSTDLYSYSMPNMFNVSFHYYYFLIFFMLSYIPVFPQLYFHMLAQRKKVLGKSRPKTE